MTLESHLLSQNIPLETTKIHVIREPNASSNWQLVTKLEYSDIEEVALLETACNRASRWKSCTHVAVLIDCNGTSSPYTGFKKSYLFIGVLRVQGRAGGFLEDESGTFDNPGWILEWKWLDKRFLFRNELLPSRGYHFHAKTGTSASADQFTMIDTEKEGADYERLILLVHSLRWIAHKLNKASVFSSDKLAIFVRNFSSLFSPDFDFINALQTLNDQFWTAKVTTIDHLKT